MAALDIDGAVQSVKTMLSELSAWQTITSTGSAAAAALRIFEFGVDDSAGSESPCFILDIGEFPVAWEAGRLAGPLMIEARLELEIPEANRTTYSTEGRWFWQQLASILAGINSNVKGSGQLMFQGLSMPLKPGRIDPETNEGRIEWMCVLGFEVWLQ
jgi:hypothetical protein